MSNRLEANNIRRVGGAEQEYSLSKAKVDRTWTPNEWVTVTC